jgi:hypothetical protein
LRNLLVALQDAAFPGNNRFIPRDIPSLPGLPGGRAYEAAFTVPPSGRMGARMRNLGLSHAPEAQRRSDLTPEDLRAALTEYGIVPPKGEGGGISRELWDEWGDLWGNPSLANRYLPVKLSEWPYNHRARWVLADDVDRDRFREIQEGARTRGGWLGYGAPREDEFIRFIRDIPHPLEATTGTPGIRRRPHMKYARLHGGPPGADQIRALSLPIPLREILEREMGVRSGYSMNEAVTTLWEEVALGRAGALNVPWLLRLREPGGSSYRTAILHGEQYNNPYLKMPEAVDAETVGDPPVGLFDMNRNADPLEHVPHTSGTGRMREDTYLYGALLLALQQALAAERERA